MAAKEPKFQPQLAYLREKAGLTQLELSRIVGVTETTIANWERGRSGMDWFERIIRLCKALNCQVQDLVQEAVPIEPKKLLPLEELGELAAIEPAPLEKVAAIWAGELDGSERSEPSAPEGQDKHSATQR